MVSRFSALAVIAPAVLLAACGGSANRGLESVHQPVVTRTDYAIDLGTSGYGLAPGEQQRLAGWMQAMSLGYGDRVYVDDPGGNASGVRTQVAAEASRYGLLLSDTAPVIGSPITPGTVRVIVTRMRASVPNCPDYSGMDQPNFDEHTSSNFGCATNSNLAAMVAQPEDLVRGQPGSGTSDPQTAVKAIDSLREKKPTGTQALPSVSTGGPGGGSN